MQMKEPEHTPHSRFDDEIKRLQKENEELYNKLKEKIIQPLSA